MSSDKVPSKQADLSSLWLVAAAVFLLCYLSGAYNLDDFELDNWSYVINRDIWGELTGNFTKSVMLYFDPQQVSSIMWKAFFLFPASFCTSVWIGCHLSFSERIGSFFTKFLEARWCLVTSIGVAFLAIVILIVFVFQGKPLVDDEYAYMFQAKTYLTGHVALPPPPAAKSFSDFHILTAPVWTGKYLFGHPFFLAIGLALGSPYVASVAMSVASIALIFILGVRTGTKYQAAVATWLVAVSPWFLFTSATLLSHVSTLFLFLVAAIGWTTLEKRPNALVALGIGLCMGWSFAVRPLTALLLAVPFAYLTGRHVFKDPRNWLRVSTALALGGLAVVALVLLYDKTVTGNHWQMPFSAYWPGEKLGFGCVLPVAHPREIYHTPIKGIMNLAVSAIRVNSWFLGWPLSFLPLLGLFAFGVGRKSAEEEPPEPLGWNSWDSLWISVIGVFCLGYIFYYSSGVSDTGPVYYYELLVPLSLLSAKGILRGHRMLADSGLKSLRHFVPVFCLVSTIGAFVFFVPEKAHHNQMIHELAYYPFEMAERQIEGKAIVFVGRRPHIGWINNRPQASPKLDDRILFLRLLDDSANEAAIKAFPDRKPFRLIYETRENKFVVQPYASH